MTIRAFILAGGKGTRLSPLTDTRPKPLVPLGGSKRTLEYVIDNYTNAGIFDIYIAVQYMADRIERYFGNGSEFQYAMVTNSFPSFNLPLSVKYCKPSKEHIFDGTADALRKSRAFLADAIEVREISTGEISKIPITQYLEHQGHYQTIGLQENYTDIIVANGDLLTNFDFSRLLEFHHNKKGIATIATYRIPRKRDIVGQYGLVLVNAENRITGFKEKPKRIEDVETNLINTGVYIFNKAILDELNATDWLDFGHDVFPALLQSQALYSCEMSGYWNDIGTRPSYMQTNMQLIDGVEGITTSSVKLIGYSRESIQGTLRHSISSPGCYVHPKAVVSNSVLARNVRIENGIQLSNSVILEGSEIMCSDEGNGWLIDTDVKIEDGAKIGNNVVIGRGSIIKSGAVVHNGVIIGAGHVVTGEVSKNMSTEYAF